MMIEGYFQLRVAGKRHRGQHLTLITVESYLTYMRICS